MDQGTNPVYKAALRVCRPKSQGISLPQAHLPLLKLFLFFIVALRNGRGGKKEDEHSIPLKGIGSPSRREQEQCCSTSVPQWWTPHALNPSPPPPCSPPSLTNWQLTATLSSSSSTYLLQRGKEKVTALGAPLREARETVFHFIPEKTEGGCRSWWHNI